MRRRRLLLFLLTVACGSRECSLDPSPSCSYRPERGVDGPDAAVDGIANAVRSVHAGDTHACALLSTGDGGFGDERVRPRCWGGNRQGQLAQLASPAPGELWWYSRWESGGTPFAVGAAHACLIDENDPGDDGEPDSQAIECWGNNRAGQLGVEPDEPGEGILEVARPEDAFGLTLGALHGCVSRNTGVECWGDNRWGQLGAPDRECCDLVDVGALWDDDGPDAFVATLAAGSRHTCAAVRILDEPPRDSLWCWGDGEYGQLGRDASMEPSVPVSVGVDSALEGYRLQGLAAGPHHTCAVFLQLEEELRTELVCWGRNQRGELGLGTTGHHAAPTIVPLEGEPLRIFAGGESGVRFESDLSVEPAAAHTCALDLDGHAWCWGDNSAGQLGMPPGDPIPEPTATHPELRFAWLALGGRFTCGAERGQERVWCWGDNTEGQLGRPGESSHEPTEVPVFRETFAPTGD